MNRAAIHYVQAQTATYEEIAPEYYDRNLHPTCWSFGELSKKFMHPRLSRLMSSNGDLVEIGAGLSVLAPEAEKHDLLARVILVDQSVGMLTYSSKWISKGARTILAPAHSTGLPNHSASLVVSSLGDPYNDEQFWKEVSRILEPGGTCLFSIPAFAWASSFRDEKKLDTAEFIRSDGTQILVPSYIYPEEQQHKLIETAGLNVLDCQNLNSDDLEEPCAPKLRCVSRKTPLLVGYEIQAPIGR